MTETNKLEFVADVVILRKKVKNKNKTTLSEHWYFTIPVPIRRLIDKKNRIFKVTLERINMQD